MLQRMRNTYERTISPIGQISARIGLSPDAWTIISLVMAALAGVAFALERFVWGLAMMLLMGLADVFDGATARATGRVTPFGGVLDHVVDRYAEFCIMLGIMLSGRVAAWWALFSLFGIVMASYVRAKAESMTDLASCNVGLAGRQEKMYILVAGIVVELLNIGTGALQWGVIITGVMSHITAVQRLLYTRRETTPPTTTGSLHDL